jgi:hypothetical protein
MKRFALLCLPLAAVLGAGCGLDQSEDFETVRGAYTAGPFALGSDHGGSGGDILWEIKPTQLGDHLKQWLIWSGTMVDAIQIYYEKPDGTIYSGGKVGGTGGALQPPMLLGSGQYINQVSGKAAASNDKICVRNNAGTQLCGGGNGGFDWGPDNTSGTNQLGGLKARFHNLVDHIWFYQYTP